MILIIVSEGWYLFLQCVCYSSYPFCLRAHGFLIDGWGDAHQQVPLIHVVGWCLDDVIARVTTYKRQKLLPWRSFFFFFPVVKCGQSLKQWNECVNLHKGKERHSRVLECLCLCMCVCDCVQKCVCAFETFLLPIPAQLYLTVHSQLCNIWLMLYRVLTYKVCWLQNKWMLFTVYVFGC